MSIPLREKSSNVIEPLMKPQRWIYQKPLTKAALAAVKNGEVTITPRSSSSLNSSTGSIISRIGVSFVSSGGVIAASSTTLKSNVVLVAGLGFLVWARFKAFTSTALELLLKHESSLTGSALSSSLLKE